MSECIPVAKVCDNCACYEVCIYANPGRKKDCSLWKPDMSWIPVSERLPEINGDFLTAILFEDGDVLVDISFWFDRCWTSPDLENVNVTHWIPLPRPPKEATNV